MFERTKAFLKYIFPSGARAFGRVRRAVVARGISDPDAAAVFSHIYRENGWENAESVSGRGSTLARTRVVREALPGLLEEVGAGLLFDAACGDFNWMREVDLRGVRYLGADVVPELVESNRALHGGEGREFIRLDVTKDSVPKADVILCRDCLIHLSFKHARAAIANFKRSGSTFLLATTHTNVSENRDIRTGQWRPVNLLLPPFTFPAPARLIVEDEELGKCLGMWRLDEL
ncbi:MAG: class I SAM-dependent methyltransferase [Rubrivivax sp.]|nr:class I SAM-dependent methyltransferase [Pyrinomonadaceae bacterium]